MRKTTLLVLLSCYTMISYAQRGKNGTLTVASAVTVNEYTTLTANASVGNTSISVALGTLNANGRFAKSLDTGDLIMIIQMQGATIRGRKDPADNYRGLPSDTSWGGITNYNNCGKFEFAEVASVNGNIINLDCQLINSYTAAGRVQVVRVPRYNSLTINNGGTIGCDAWDSAKGGVVAIEVLNNTIINSGGKIDVSNQGFRPGKLDNDSSGYGVFNYAVQFMSYGKEKGEGIAGYGWQLNQFGGRYGKGSPANGGGGGNAHNGGGGGGSNAGDTNKWFNGDGTPDASTANFINAWKQEETWLSAFTGSGGGRGGYSFSSNNLDPTLNKPQNAAWGGDNRNINGGLGGRPLDYTTGRLFLGGGGGAGDQDNNFAGNGGSGGGMVYLTSYGTVSGTGTINANGQNGVNSQGTPAINSYAGQDGAGGAGGGGTIVVNSVGNISGVGLNANGGVGGNQVFTTGAFFFGTVKEAEGPGGGGGGGYIATSNAGPAQAANGGANGTSNSPAMTKFPQNGATKGGIGITGAVVTNFHIVALNDTICSGQQATLNASLVGTVPGGTGIEWYTSPKGGSPVASGPTYTTPVLFANTTYYVGTCPGTYRQAVNVIIGAVAVTTINPPATICNGQNTGLNATGGTAYSWAPAASLNNPNIANPTATPTITTTYTVNITTPCGNKKDSVTITVNPLPTVTFSGVTTICAGSNTTVTANGGTTYSWSTGATTSSISVTPPSTQTYTVHVTAGGCTKDTTVTVTVNPVPVASVSGTDSVCAGNSTTLTASGGTSYLWNTGATTSSITVTPPSTITYTVHVTALGCTKDTTITVTVNSIPAVSINPPTPGICAGGSIGLAATGASSYNWAPSTGLTCTSCANPTANPASTTTYTVVGTGPGGCTDTVMVTVTVGNLTATVTGVDSICKGGSTTLTVNGGSTYAWSNGATTSSITVSPSLSTTYIVIASSGNCTDTVKYPVAVTPLPNAQITGNNAICAGDSTILTASGGGTYLWNNAVTTSSINVKPASTTTYSVTVSNGGCTKDTSITVTVNSKPVPTINTGDTVCAGTAIQLTATGGTSYTWLPATGLSSANISNPIATPPATTEYTVTVANGGCTATDSVLIVVHPVIPISTFASPPVITNGGQSNLNVTPAGSFLWTPSATLSCDTCQAPIASPTVTTWYYVTVTEPGGCTERDSVLVTVTENCGATFVPTGFSPNGDGQNDVLYVKGNCIQSMELDIYDRWGNLVFKSEDPTIGWDGTYGGKVMDAANFVYTFKALLIDGTTVDKKGNITLVR